MYSPVSILNIIKHRLHVWFELDQDLSPHREEDIDGEMDDLGVDEGHGEVSVAGHLRQPAPEVRESAHEVGEAGLVRDELLPLGRVQHLDSPLDRDPPPAWRGEVE